VIRPFPARISALSSDALKELTSIPAPASNGARAFGKCGSWMRKWPLSPTCNPAIIKKPRSGAMTRSERGCQTLHNR
jgi:hypothetical protein